MLRLDESTVVLWPDYLLQQSFVAEVRPTFYQAKPRSTQEVSEWTTDEQQLKCTARALEAFEKLSRLVAAVGPLYPPVPLFQQPATPIPFIAPAEQLASLDLEPGPPPLTAGRAYEPEQLHNVLCRNVSGAEVRVAVGGRWQVVPRGAAFLTSVLGSAALLAGLPPADLLLLDPPWPNHSAARAGAYAAVAPAELLRLPLAGLRARGGLVAVWVTNNPAHFAFVRDVLLPAAGVRLAAVWLWLKCSAGGAPLVRPGGRHRQPFEQLLVGAPPGRSLAPLCLAAPPSLHSRKPPLGALFAPLLPAQPACTELFARSLSSGWTAWGNEPLHFQDAAYFAP